MLILQYTYKKEMNMKMGGDTMWVLVETICTAIASIIEAIMQMM